MVTRLSLVRPGALPRQAPRGRSAREVQLDKWVDHPGYGLTPQRLVQIFALAEAGYPREQCDLFEDLVESDAHLRNLLEQRCQGTLQVWAEPFTPLRLPKVFNVRTDPYEFADVTSNTYYDFCLQRAYLLIPAQKGVADFLATFKEFPPRQKAASFSIDQVVDKMTAVASGGG